ncbi:MAG: hypothetical protein PVG75_09485 [Thioalkalispiraceae bacterium]|jgi:hypothetical protein
MYKIQSIVLDESLSSETGKPWYRYTISNNYNTINGLKAGTKSEITRHARLCILSLNQKYKQPNKAKVRAYKPVKINQLVYS